MMHCVQCGTELPEGSRFCISCGVRQPEAAAEKAAEHSPEPPCRSGEPGSAVPAAEPFTAGTDGASGDASAGGMRPDTRSVPASELPPVVEPIAVRLTKAGGEAASEAPGGERQSPEEESPPRMRPVAAGSREARFAPPPPEPHGDRRVLRGEERPDRRTSSGGRGASVWLVPPLLALFTAGALLWQVNVERGISAEASGIQRTAADAALGGNYEIAEAKLGEALEKRPGDPGIRSDLQAVRTIRRLEDRLAEAQRLLSGADASGAAVVLDEVQGQLTGLQGRAYDRLRDRLDRLREQLELAGLRTEAEGAQTLDELAGLMKTASASPAPDKGPVVELISDRIVKVGGDEAEQAIASGSYYEAAAVVDEARSYVPEAERLIELEKRISSLASEGGSDSSGLVYLSGAELAAGTGELRMEGFERQLEDEGLVFSGRLTNASSAPMYDLLIEFRAYDANGSFLGEEWTELQPTDLKPGGQASFTDKVASAEEGAIVIIDSVSWYRE
ncbi:FxLYD domain-containing protein [Saccharibacillus alkalitolerans]|uniref:Zinc-ribbon domain-containing protein n=1 Tax=Saccharibacillus alkalitolerans TaxID=2705290 RepID=A0ABX0FAN3_9BACL|nr:FxLYD domain-containing protein [Saccharibacillus alkalitolerans]NGZ78008.1 hypothetical protein [Saccharibacillus alkalitolerans]